MEITINSIRLFMYLQDVLIPIGTLICFDYVIPIPTRADPSGRAVEGAVLQSFDCWDCWFETR